MNKNSIITCRACGTTSTYSGASDTCTHCKTPLSEHGRALCKNCGFDYNPYQNPTCPNCNLGIKEIICNSCGSFYEPSDESPEGLIPCKGCIVEKNPTPIRNAASETPSREKSKDGRDWVVYFAIDNNNFMQLMTPLWQLRASGRQVQIYDCDKVGLDPELKQFVKETMPYVSFHDIQDKWFYKLSKRAPWHPNSCLGALEVLGTADCELGIFLDSDTFLLGDINEIFEYGLHPNESIGGVTDIWLACEGKESRREYTGIEQWEYINSGMVLFNPKLYKELGLYEKSLEEAKIMPKYPDQDILNKIAKHKQLLPMRFNGCGWYWNTIGREGLSQRDMVLWHYYAQDKPHRHYPSKNYGLPYYKEYRAVYEEILNLLAEWRIAKSKSPVVGFDIYHSAWGKNTVMNAKATDTICIRSSKDGIEGFGKIHKLTATEFHVLWDSWQHELDIFEYVPEKGHYEFKENRSINS